MSDLKARDAFLMDLAQLQTLCERGNLDWAQDVATRLMEHDNALRLKVAELEAFIAGAQPRLEIADRAVEYVVALDTMLVRTPEDRQVPIEELLRRRIAGE